MNFFYWTRPKTISLSLMLVLIAWTGLSRGAIPLSSLLPQKDLPEGWILTAPPETYTRKTLFHRIDGQAELFFKYGYQKSIFGRYQNQKRPGQEIELDIYDMGNVLQAFGIFSRFRSEHRPMGVGLDSFIDEQSAFFYKGPYFVMLFSTEPHSPFLKSLATSVSSRITDSSPPPREIDLFPKERLKPGSIEYISEGLLGRKFLGRGFQGIYLNRLAAGTREKPGGKVDEERRESKLFIAFFQNPQGAINAFKLYRDDLTRKGRVHQLTSDTLKGEEGYQGRVLVVQRKHYLLGAIGFEEEEGNLVLNDFLRNFHLKPLHP